MFPCLRQKDPQQINSDKIDKEIKRSITNFNQTIKFLLLGTGESGKSTFFKQMKILYDKGFSDEERAGLRQTVYVNIIENMIILLEAKDKFGLTLKPENEESSKKIITMDAAQLDISTWTGIAEVVPDLKSLWSDPTIQQCSLKGAEIQLPDSAEYFYNDLDRIAQSDYIPSVDDVLRLRTKTSGITFIDVPIENNKFRFVDVGGQRSERRKWLHCFDDVAALVFFVALNEYDQKLREDNETNRMSESLVIFEQLMTMEALSKTSVILFLNKFDLFKVKIKKVPLNVLFEDYKGSDDPDVAADFIKDKFIKRAGKKAVYPHKTIATDSNNIKHVWRAVKDIIVHKYLGEIGVYV